MFQIRAETSLLSLLGELEARGYDFVTPNNGTIRAHHARKPRARAGNLQDVFGWSLPFASGELDSEVEALLVAAGAVKEMPAGYLATVRVSQVQGRLFLHSAYPTSAEDAVFLGPDSYRFAEFLRVELERSPAVRRVCDIGTGSGVGGILSALLTGSTEVCLSDINPKALQLAKVNAAHVGLAPTLNLGSGLQGCGESLDLVVTNPPFIADGGKTYSDGGGMYGLQLTLEWALQAMERLSPAGRLLVYTGSAIVDGRDPFREELALAAQSRGLRLRYRELDPDIFNSQLKRQAYAGVDRIAAVGAVVEASR